MSCEYCGRKGTVLPVVKAGRRIFACPACIREKGLAPITNRPVPVVRVVRRQIIQTAKSSLRRLYETPQLVENYGAIVRQAREKLGLTQADLAARIAERLSVIKKIEAGRLKPDERLARKLEQILKIKLFEEVE